MTTPATRATHARSRRLILALAGSTACAPMAAGQNTVFRTEVARPCGEWGPSISAYHGETVSVRVRVTFVGQYPATATTRGFAGATYQPTLAGYFPALGDALAPLPPTGAGVAGCPVVAQACVAPFCRAVGRLLPFASAGQGTGSASGLLTSFVEGGVLRFAGSRNTTPTTDLRWGVINGQTPNILACVCFVSAIDVVGFQYEVTIGRAGPGRRHLIAAVPHEYIANGRVNWYQNDGGHPVLQAPIRPQDVIPATIHVYPRCVADVDDGGGLGVRDDAVTIDDLIHYLGLFYDGDPNADVTDGGGANTPDGGVTIDDALFYFARYLEGC